MADDERTALLAAIEDHGAELRRMMSRAGTDPLLGSGLTMQQFRVIMLLTDHGRLPQGDLAQILGVSLASVTGLVDRLVARGVVERTASPRDRRVRLAGLTTQGVALVEEVTTEGRDILYALVRAVDTEALRGLERGLAAMRGAIGPSGTMGGVSTAVFQNSRLHVLFAIVLAICAVPVAFGLPFLWPIMLVPVAIVVWVLRVRTTVDAEAVTVRRIVGSRRVPWSEISTLHLKDRRVSAVLSDGAELPLPATRVRDLPQLAAVSGGRLPDPAGEEA